MPILQPGQTVILDNATFHKSKKIVEFIKSVGAEILYLTPYSPDFNDIEHHWFAIKTEPERTFLFSNLFVKLLIMLFFNCFYYYEKGYTTIMDELKAAKLALSQDPSQKSV